MKKLLLLSKKKLFTLPLVFSVLLHLGVLIFIFADFNFWEEEEYIKEIAVKAVFLPDTKTDTDERIAQHKPVPPPPPPPPPKKEKKKKEPQVKSAPVPPEEVKKEVKKTEEDLPSAPVPPEKVKKTLELSQSILKTLEKVEIQPPKGEEQISTIVPESVTKEEPIPQNVTEKATLSNEEIQVLRKALAQCWSISAGTRKIANLRVSIRISLAQNGLVKNAQIVDKARFNSDAAFRVTAEDALRSLHHPKCKILPLPENKYKSWKTITLEFDPQQMLR